MFELLKKLNKQKLFSTNDGLVIPLSDIDDEVFSKELIGQGLAIKPYNQIVYSPVDGVIEMIFPTNHALGIRLDNGLELLIHIGIDTVKLKGTGFKRISDVDSRVKKGDPLIEFDKKVIENAGYSNEIILVITSPKNSYSIDKIDQSKQVKVGEILFEVKKKL